VPTVSERFATRESVLSSGVHVISVHGPADLFTARELREILCAGVDANVGRLIVDLREVTVLDSSGLSALLAAYRRSGQLGGAITFVHDDTDIGRTLQITGLDLIFDVVSSIGAARERYEPAD
jgi:anti-anti-sigma factor